MLARPRLRPICIACLLFLLAGSPVVGAEFTDPDRAVAELAAHCAARLALMREVAAYKWLHDAPVADPKRETQLLARLSATGAAAGFDTAAVQRFFAANVALAREEQARLMVLWSASGFGFDGMPRDLRSELRPAIDALNDALLRSLALAGPALEAPDFVERHRGRFVQAFASLGLDVDAAGLEELLAATGDIRRRRAPDLESVQALRLLRVGLTGDYAPFSYLRGDVLDGADVELAKSLADHLDVELRFVPTSWPALMSDFVAGRFDIAMGGITRTTEREKLGSFSRAYFRGGKTIVARCTETAAYDTLAELAAPGVRLIVNPGGTNERFVREHVREQTPIVFPDNTGIPAELLAGRADAMITDDIEVALWQRLHPGLCRATPRRFTDDAKAYLMPRDPELLSAVDEWLEPLLSSGTASRLLDEALDPARQ